MKNSLRIFFVLASVLMTSCANLNNWVHERENKDPRAEKVKLARKNSMWLEVEIFQTLSKTEVLALDQKHNVVKIVSLSDKLLYDGLELWGEYVLIDTYSYYNKDKFKKTVPVYVLLSEYEKYYLE